MFNGMMMDPELMRLAQEQMSRMSPAEMAQIQQQMMSNPELMRMATESMQTFKADDFKQAAEQLKHISPEEMAEMRERMTNASPEELASMRSRMDAQVSYEISAAEMLKKQGNTFHSQGKYENALQKYIHAKKNLREIPTSKARNIVMACSLNMMSCYLKTNQYDECIKEGTEVLAYDPNNVKALYRRGQAYKEFGNLGDAVSDLSKALEVSPGDETIADVLRDTEEKLTKEGSGRRPRGLVIEDITDEEIVSSGSKESSKSGTLSRETGGSSTNPKEISSANTEYLDALKDNPESIRSFQNFMSSTDPATLAALNGGQIGDMPPEMIKTASNMINKMSPEELQNMLKLASSVGGENNPFPNSGSGFNPGSIPPNLSPDMLKTATDMMGKMSPGEIQKMAEMASSLKGKSGPDFGAGSSAPPTLSPDMQKMAFEMMNKMSPEEKQKMFEMASSFGQKTRSTSGASDFSGLRTDDFPTITETVERDGSDAGESSSVQGLNFPPSFPSSTGDMQEQMRNQMKDPAMRQMFSSMMKNMDPEMMANMSEQFGIKLSRVDAEKAQQAMSSLTPESLDTMMKWVDRIQRGVQGAKKTKNWLLGRPGMILAVFMLLVAFFLHWLGFIGR